MEDKQIIDLYLQRDDHAITETKVKYGTYCTSIAYNILESIEDTEECVSDTWLQAWNAIPPQLPQCLRAFLSRITRNLALNRHSERSRIKRGGGQVLLALEELGQCADPGPGPEESLLSKELSESISRFLRTLPARERNIFVGRYYYLYSVAEIARRLGLKANYTANILLRTRIKLRSHLQKEGYVQ